LAHVDALVYVGGVESSFNFDAKTKIDFLKKLPGRERLAESLGVKPEKCLVV
jgi:hypothetical protein